jgi:hypothetical protein
MLAGAGLFLAVGALMAQTAGPQVFNSNKGLPPVLAADGVTKISGSQYLEQLVFTDASAGVTTFTPVGGPVHFYPVTSPARAGVWNSGTLNVQFPSPVQQGDVVTLAVEVWDSSIYATYADAASALAATGGNGAFPANVVGISEPFAYQVPTDLQLLNLLAAEMTAFPGLQLNAGVRTLIVPTIVTPPTVTGVIVGSPESSGHLVGGAASVPGAFAFANSNAVLTSAGSTTIPVVFTPADSLHYATVTSQINATVRPGTPTITAWPVVSGLTVGQPVSDAVLSGGIASVPGVFGIATSQIQFSRAGLIFLTIEFTPADQVDYFQVTSTVTATVGRGIPIIAWPTIKELILGKPVAASSLTGGGASTRGVFSFANPAQVFSNLGPANVLVVFTPQDQVDYLTVTNSVAATVIQGISVTWPAVTGLVVGKTLSAGTLVGGSASVPGLFSFAKPGQVLSHAGLQAVSVVFTPSDSTNYLPVASGVNAMVAPGTPVVGPWPAVTGLSVTHALSAGQLTGGAASVPGVFSFANPSLVVAKAGPIDVLIVFTPTDIADYLAVTNSVAANVPRGVVAITAWPTISGLTVNQPLINGTLSGGAASVAGSFVFANPQLILVKAGSTGVSVIFQPADPISYYPVTISIAASVARATPLISTWPVISGLTAGSPLSTGELTGGVAPVPGSFNFPYPWVVIGRAGSVNILVVFQPADSADYVSVTKSLNADVAIGVPAITALPVVTGLTLGQPLSIGKLVGGSASTPGGFGFADPGLIMSKVGLANVAVVFTPSDLADYRPVTNSVVANVAKIVPTVTSWPSVSGLIVFQAQVNGHLTGGAASVPGVFAFADPQLVSRKAGPANVLLVFKPSDMADYTTVTNAAAATVSAAKTPIAAWPAVRGLAVGQPLSTGRLTGGLALVPGTFSFVTPDQVIGKPGPANVLIRFMPADTLDYFSVTNSVAIVVEAVPTVSSWPDISGLKVFQPIVNGKLTGGGASVPGSFVFADPQLIIRKAGPVSVLVIFKPSDSTDYATVANSVTATVSAAAPPIAAWPKVSGIVVGQPLSTGKLAGGVALVPGTFAFATPTLVMATTGPTNVLISFSPVDSLNYLSVTNPVSATVSPAFALRNGIAKMASGPKITSRLNLAGAGVLAQAGAGFADIQNDPETKTITAKLPADGSTAAFLEIDPPVEILSVSFEDDQILIIKYR